jgi:hypothetical protein
MKTKHNRWWAGFAVIFTLFTMIGCSILSTSKPNPTPAPTLTPTSDFVLMTNRCEGLSGTLELQVLVGPSDAVGLEPLAVGEIPFSVMNDGDSYTVQGGGNLTYEDILAEEWGTYTVKFNMDTTVTGTCALTDAGEKLNMNLKASGDQMVEVRAEGFQGDYPWTGTHEFDLSYPLEEGAYQEGEGWMLVLHIHE